MNRAKVAVLVLCFPPILLVVVKNYAVNDCVKKKEPVRGKIRKMAQGITHGYEYTIARVLLLTNKVQKLLITSRNPYRIR